MVDDDGWCKLLVGVPVRYGTLLQLELYEFWFSYLYQPSKCHNDNTLLAGTAYCLRSLPGRLLVHNNTHHTLSLA
jgi:hypothetical protein